MGLGERRGTKGGSLGIGEIIDEHLKDLFTLS